MKDDRKDSFRCLHCSRFVESGRDTVRELIREGTRGNKIVIERKLDDYSFYCEYGPGRIKKIGSKAGWTGRTPVWCPEKNCTNCRWQNEGYCFVTFKGKPADYQGTVSECPDSCSCSEWEMADQ